MGCGVWGCFYAPFFIGEIMRITFYKCLDGENVINKRLEFGAVVEIHLKNDVDWLNPSIYLVTDVSDYNYCEMNGRFYFVEKSHKINNRVSIIDLKTDVLETYKSDILKSHARYERPIKDGDYHQISYDESHLQSINIYKSDIEIDLRNENYILSAMGA